MELLSDFQEIKLVITMALGLICYRKLRKAGSQAEDWEMSDSEEVQQEEEIGSKMDG